MGVPVSSDLDTSAQSLTVWGSGDGHRCMYEPYIG